MSTLIDEPSVPNQTNPHSERMRHTMTAARLSFNWLGVRKSLTSDQKTQAAHSFDAESKYLSASKKLLDTSHPAFKAVSSIRSRILAFWKGNSLPYPEPGIRLIKRERIVEFDEQFANFHRELDDAVQELEDRYTEMREAARERLGDLFNLDDYPATLGSEFGFAHDYPSVEPPNYLRQLSPELYEQECRRVRARFTEAVQLAEQAFLEEFGKLVEHLTDRLSGAEDGKPKVFRDSAVTNMADFFQRFGDLNVGSNEQLDQLVQQAQQIIANVPAQNLRDSDQLRQRVATQLSSVQARLDQLMVDRPRRNIQRRAR